jgi:nucleotide-binding universal stress UspA family protein
MTPVDGSVHAQMALDLSTDLAAKYDAQVVLLHVVTHDNYVPREHFDEAERELIEAQVDDGNEESAVTLIQRAKVLQHFGYNLLRGAQEFAKNKGVKQVETVIDEGAADKRIIHHAKNRPVDLIVMGNRGFGKLKGLVLGSVSHNVFHLAPCSCVMVHLTSTQPTFAGIKRILVPTDGSTQADKAVDLACDIAARYGAKISLVYVACRGPSLETLRSSIDMEQLSESARGELDPAQHPIAEHVSSGLIPPVVSNPALKEIGEQVLERARQTALAKAVSSTSTLLMAGDPARKILQVARRERADLITMGSRGLGGAEGLLAGSVSYKVNHNALCNCLFVR